MHTCQLSGFWTESPSFSSHQNLRPRRLKSPSFEHRQILFPFLEHHLIFFRNSVSWMDFKKSLRKPSEVSLSMMLLALQLSVLLLPRYRQEWRSAVHAAPVAPTFVTSTTFVTAHQFCQFISTAFVNLTTFVNFCQLRAHQFCQQYQPLMSLQTRSLLLSTRPAHFCQP